MSNAKKVLYLLTAGFAAGAILGILYAPVEGSEIRKRIGKLKAKLGCHKDDRTTALEDLRDTLQDQLDKINEELHAK